MDRKTLKQFLKILRSKFPGFTCGFSRQSYPTWSWEFRYFECTDKIRYSAYIVIPTIIPTFNKHIWYQRYNFIIRFWTIWRDYTGDRVDLRNN